LGGVLGVAGRRALVIHEEAMMLHALCAFAPAWKCAPRGDLRREQRGATRCRQEHERGGSLVELAIVLSVLLLLLLGCGELSGIYKDSLVLRQAAREGVRIAAVGATEEAIATRVRMAAPTLDSGRITIETRYSADDGATFHGVPGVVDGRNDIPAGSLIRVRATYPRRLATRVVLPGWTEVTLRCNMIIQRQ